MARDLIPPPSPAGRPAPDPHEPEPFEPVAPAEDAEATPARPAAEAPYRTRFGFVTGALIGCAVVAALGLATLLTGGKPAEEGLATNWSLWHPTTTDPYTGAGEIAQHVGREYRDAKRKQLVDVSGGPVAYGQVPLTVAVRPAQGDIQVLDGIGVQYTLNGLGDSGSFKDGKSLPKRDRLLHREALELALYSFRYLDHLSMVVTLLPPVRPKPKAKKLQLRALLYRPDDLRPQLEVPLDRTLSVKAPPIGGFPAQEAHRVDSLTLSNVFKASIQQAQNARAYLLLERGS